MTFLSGKVLDIIKKGKEVKSADASVLALIEAFDKGVVLAIVEPNLIDELAKGQTVILKRESPNPQTTIFIVTKIVSGNTAKVVNEAFAKQFKKIQEMQKHQVEQHGSTSGMIG